MPSFSPIIPLARRWLLRAAPVAVSLGFILSGCGGPSGEPAVPAGVRGAATGRAAAHAGAVVYLDASGRPIVPTPAAPADAEPGRAAARRELQPDATPLPLRVEPAPGGGDMIVTRGRLLQSDVARLTPEHRLVTECERPNPAEERGAAR